MAATLDKDTLAKHSFWILAGTFVVLVLGCLTVLATSVSDSVRKEQDDLKKAQDLVQGIKDPKNPAYEEAYKKQDQFVNGKKDDVWGKAWKTQEDMMTWPRDLQARFQKYKYFGDDIPPLADRSDFDDKYAAQLVDVWEVVQPVKSKGEGVVQCKGPWTEVLQLDRTFAQKPPTKDDIWLTQEELWVKREMLRIIRDANESVARFKEVAAETGTDKGKKEGKASAGDQDAKTAKPETGAADKSQEAAKSAPAPAAAPKADSNHKIFRNAYWEFDLTLVGPESGKYFLRGKLTNIGRRKQPLDTKFKVFLQDIRAADEPAFQLISMGDLPLAVGESKQINQPVEAQKAIEGLFGVEQVLNWRTAAVKRLDDLKLMDQAQSSRTIVRMLKPPGFISTASPEGGDSSASADAAQTAGAVPGGPGGSAGPVQATTTLNGLELNRYTEVSEQVRYMPVAMVVVVDEEHLPELLAAFVNSKLRIQITQYHWQHCRDRMNPSLNEPENFQYVPGQLSSGPMARGERPSSGMPRGATSIGGRNVQYGVRSDYPGPGGRGSGVRPGAPGVPFAPSGGRMPMAGGPGPVRPGPSVPGMGRSLSSGPGTVSEEDEEQEDLNLLEVAVYGLASLYERYPPAPKKTEQGTPEEKPAADSTGGK
jgi:hypothetical protein